MPPLGVLSTRYQRVMAIVRTKTQWAVLSVGLIFLFTVPPLFLSDYWLSFLNTLGIYAIAVLGLHLLTGLCGQISLGQAAFVAIGGYTTAILTNRFGLSPWATLPLAGISAGLIGLLFGTPSLRIRGFYLAMATIAAQFIIIWLLTFFVDWSGGPAGKSVEPLSLGGKTLRSPSQYYFVTMALVVLLTIFARNIQRTRTGRTFVAIRDNDLAAQVMGVNLFYNKLLAFFIGCFYAGIAGWLWAHTQLRITPGQFGIDKSVWFIGMLIVGGIGSTGGALCGTGLVQLLEVIRDYLTPIIGGVAPMLRYQIGPAFSLMLFSLVVILILIFEPRGIYHRWEIFKSRLHLY